MYSYKLVNVTSSDGHLQNVLANLTKMYCYEWSQYTGMDVDNDGKYIFEKYISCYWEKPDRRAFLLLCDTGDGNPKWAGFALTDRDFIIHNNYDNSLAEFFVMHKYRRHGAGSHMAKALFDMFPGKWELGRNPKNINTISFWNRVVSEYTNGNFELVYSCPEHRYPDGTLGDVFAFDNSKRGI